MRKGYWTLPGRQETAGVELFVLDDGWFGQRCTEHAGLGDWVANRDRLPEGIAGLARRIGDLGMQFGLWFEPEMVNKDSDLYRAHPDWILHVTRQTVDPRQVPKYVLDFSRKEVVGLYLRDDGKDPWGGRCLLCKMGYEPKHYRMLSAPLFRQTGKGRCSTGTILGVYDLYERLTSKFPYILFESCASGGGRFDPGMLYYAPQAWTSDDSDAVERLMIQHGTVLLLSGEAAWEAMCPLHPTTRPAGSRPCIPGQMQRTLGLLAMSWI